MTGTSFVIPATSQDLTDEFQPDQRSGLSGEVKIGDRQTMRDDNTLSGIQIPPSHIDSSWLLSPFGFQEVGGSSPRTQNLHFLFGKGS